MIVGVDFDNTIVCYDRVFHAIARERHLIPLDLPVTKSAVRDFLRRANQENAWTQLQGYVYGEGMNLAEAYPGVGDFFVYCNSAGIRICIISHKTRHPLLGAKYDLHRCSQQWLEENGFYEPGGIGLLRDNVYFEVTKEEKLDRIRKTCCDVFIDDLPELLGEPGFPSGVERILFDCSGTAPADLPFTKVRSWDRMKDIICAKQPQA